MYHVIWNQSSSFAKKNATKHVSMVIHVIWCALKNVNHAWNQKPPFFLVGTRQLYTALKIIYYLIVVYLVTRCALPMCRILTSAQRSALMLVVTVKHWLKWFYLGVITNMKCHAICNMIWPCLLILVAQHRLRQYSPHVDTLQKYNVVIAYLIIIVMYQLLLSYHVVTARI